MRIGDNPQRDKKVDLGNYFHQVIVPVYIPHLDIYYKDSFEVFKISILSLIKTSHSKTFISVISNGSCDAVNDYISGLYLQNKIHEFTITKAIGKLNSILKGLSGNTLPLVTITDADVLFLNNWQKATYDVFEHFPKAGVVGPVPTPFTSFYGTANIFRLNLLKKNIKYSKIKNFDGLIKFAESIGNFSIQENTFSYKNLTISNEKFRAVLGCGHFVATYKSQIFDFGFQRSTEYLLGGDSEHLLLDSKGIQLDLWNLSTEDNYAHHLGNTVTEWVPDVFNALFEEKGDFEVPKNIDVINLSYFKNQYVKATNKLFGSFKFRNLIIKRILKSD
mgnify:CR=1 FL=1